MSALTICTVLAALLYFGSGLAIVKSMKTTAEGAPGFVRWPILAGLLLQGYALHSLMFGDANASFGFGYAVSETFFCAVIILLIESWVHRLHGLFGIVLIAAAAGTLCTLLFPGQPIDPDRWTTVFRWHLILAICAYAFFVIAFVQAVLLSVMNRRLRDPASSESTFLDSMPGLVVMERIFFRIVLVGFAFITLTLIVGALATQETYGVWFHFDHKTVLTWVSWLIFGILLAGRIFAGWRARRALVWFWTGFIFLVIAYFGYSFVKELVI